MFNPYEFYKQLQKRLKEGSLILEVHEYIPPEGTILRLVWFPTGQVDSNAPQAEVSVRFLDLEHADYTILLATLDVMEQKLKQTHKERKSGF